MSMGSTPSGSIGAMAAMGLAADSPEFKNLEKTVDALKNEMGIR